MSMVLIVVLPSVAPAGAEVGDRARAAALFRRAHALYTRGDYRGSLDALDRAQVLFPSHKIELSRAFTLLALRRGTFAAEALERALALAPPDVDAAVKRQMLAKLAELRRTLARLSINSDIGRAVVKVDGRRVGLTPLSHAIYLEPGQHRLYVKRRGYSALRQRMDLDAGEHARERYSGLGEAVAERPLHRPRERKPPIYRRWWFWTAISAALGGAVIAIAASSSGSSRMPFGDSGTIRFDR